MQCVGAELQDTLWLGLEHVFALAVHTAVLTAVLTADMSKTVTVSFTA